MVSKIWMIGCRQWPCGIVSRVSFCSVKSSSKIWMTTSQIRHPSHYLPSVSQQTLTDVTHSRSASTDLLCRHFNTSEKRPMARLNEDSDVVYRGPISGMIKGVKIFSLSTSVLGICLQPIVFMGNQELPTGIKIVLGGMINFLVFLNPFIIHYIAKKYVTELHWNRSTGVFTAVTYSLFARRQELQFTAADVRIPSVPGLFTFLEARGVPLFLDPQVFKQTEAYTHLMGYDQPLDWELPPPTKQAEKEESQHER